MNCTLRKFLPVVFLICRTHHYEGYAEAGMLTVTLNLFSQGPSLPMNTLHSSPAIPEQL